MGRRRKFTDTEKYCNKCGKWLPLDAFGENRRTASGRQDYCKTCHNAYTGSFWAKVAAYEQHLQQKWRMTPDDYLELWRSQDKKCLICAAALTLYHRDTHVHAFGYQKHLLCTTCDRGMECFKNDPSLLMKALEHTKEASHDIADHTGDKQDEQQGDGGGPEKSSGSDLEQANH